MLAEYLNIYSPIVTAEGGEDVSHAPTPRNTLERVNVLKSHYMELKTDMLAEVAMVDKRIIEPAKDAKASVKQYKKVIKKREDRKLDYERYKGRVEAVEKKSSRSDRENTALAKHRIDLDSATAVSCKTLVQLLRLTDAQVYQDADDKLRSTLPQMTTATYSILPHLLNAQIMIQNTLLAQYYTSLHNYCEETGFPSPPPPMDDVITTWTRDFKPVQQEVESINCIARGKAVHQSMVIGDDASGRKSTSVTGLNVRNGIANRRASSQGRISPNPEPRVMRIPSSNSVADVTPPAPEPSPSPEPTPSYGYPSSHLTPTSSYSSHSPAGPSADYFQRGALQKKKPPPPPPKRIGSQNSGLFAVALYSFEGQGQGDLSFREGDRIKVVKKTDSTDDWWEGELKGMKGSFPANYCKIA